MKLGGLRSIIVGDLSESLEFHTTWSHRGETRRTQNSSLVIGVSGTLAGSDRNPQ